MKEMETYQNPLSDRYASDEMKYAFSPVNKYTVWHKLWLALAEGEKELGLEISDEQIQEMKKNLGKIDFSKAALYEKKTRHEVMAHIQAWGEICPKAKPILHLGATSAFVMDNGDLIQMHEGLVLIKKRLVQLIAALSKFADKTKAIPCLGYTHFQPAQLTTVGKRAALWLYDLILDYEDIEHRLKTFKLRGVKGTVGSQDSFMKLFNNDHRKVKQLDTLVSKKMGFDSSVPVSGQTYTRKLDYLILTALSNLAQSIHKMATDIRLLQGVQELEEPFGESQVGSSAMPYKRNPMRSERACSLSRFIMQMTELAAQNHATQWLERTLDDSANRRIMLPECFLAADSILLIMTNVFQGLQVYPKVIEKRIQANLPFLSAEYVMMEGVKKGKDRQELHEAFRNLAMEAVREMKEEAKESDLIEKLSQSKEIGLNKQDILDVLDPKNMIGRSENQVKDLIENYVQPILSSNQEYLSNISVDLKV